MNEHKFGVTANLIVKRSVFDQIGMFNPNLMSGGDMEFGQRVYNEKKKMSYDPSLLVFHEPRDRVQMIKKIHRVRF